MIIRAIAILVAVAVSACAAGSPSSETLPSDPAQPSEVAAASPTPGPSLPPNPRCATGDSGALPVGATCFALAPRTVGGTPVRIFYTIPAAGWSAFEGAFKDVGQGAELQRVNVSFADIRNLTVEACTNQVALDPPVGPKVDDLAAALAVLPPFEIASPPSDVNAFGYSGKHLALTVPATVVWEVFAGEPTFSDCIQGVLRTWIAPPLSFAFYGYTAPGDIEEFWILEVEGRRIAIAALRSANASAEMLAEQQAILDSVVIQP